MLSQMFSSLASEVPKPCGKRDPRCYAGFNGIFLGSCASSAAATIEHQAQQNLSCILSVSLSETAAALSSLLTVQDQLPLVLSLETTLVNPGSSTVNAPDLQPTYRAT